MPSDRDFSHDDDITNAANGDNKDNTKRKDICRDYLNNICSRGNRCKFFHPEESIEKSQNSADEPYQFCIDFQNQGCHRDNCRYVHAFREDVDRYKRSGDVTLGLARALAALLKGETINGIPLCKEFQNGHCARSSQCRYWHINRDEERRKRFAGRSCGGSPSSPAFGAYPAGPSAGAHLSRRRGDEFVNDDFSPPSKRTFSQPYATPGLLPPMSAAAPAPTHLIIELERRNGELTNEVESLKRELNREKERYDDLMSLFRAFQGQQPIQRPMVSASTLASNSLQPNISSLGGLQQQPQSLQQWGAASSSQPNWGKFDWNAN
uniref:C3H1-type domain-containing protein n=1 Tax=Globodera rostochiensis TaxID=31243 RepID=A0A914GST2_GLORO